MKGSRRLATWQSIDLIQGRVTEPRENEMKAYEKEMFGNDRGPQLTASLVNLRF